MRFSERHGYTAPAPMLEETELPDELRNCIWNVLWSVHLCDIFGSGNSYSATFDTLSMRLRQFHFRVPIDIRSSDPPEERDFIRSRYFELQFPEFYDFLEAMASDQIESVYRERGERRRDQFVKRCNSVLEQEKTCFRFISNLLTPITNEEEMAEVRNAGATDEAGSHIRRAIELYRDRTNPDYRNSVKESISAVEATYRRLNGTEHQRIGTAIAEMDKEGLHLPESLKNGFTAIYGWTNGKDGIRHPLMARARAVTEAEARLMLVMCSAYVNYLLSLSGKQAQARSGVNLP